MTASCDAHGSVASDCDRYLAASHHCTVESLCTTRQSAKSQSLYLPPHSVVHMHEWLVAHEQRPHELQCWYLQREVEGCDERHRTIRPPHAVAGLTRMVTRDTETTSKESNLQGGGEFT